MSYYRAFGLRWAADIALGGFSAAAGSSDPSDVIVTRGDGPPPERAGGTAINRGVVYPDGVRFMVDDEVTLDMYRGERVEWRPGPGWTGVLPLPFFSTVTAMLLAWRGALPIHGSAVAIDGRGVIVCGRSGFGKSSIGAGLIAAGGTLISDDLSVIAADDTGGWLLPGRPAVRLHPDTAHFLPMTMLEQPSDTSDVKTLVYPRRVDDDARIPLDTMVVLTRTPSSDSRLLAGPLLAAQTFRPHWSAKLPIARAQRAGIARLSTSLSIVEMAPPTINDAASFHAAATTLLSRLSGDEPSGKDAARATSGQR